MAANTTPKFWFEIDELKYGARFLTIAEQVQAQVDIERLTNGKFSVWSKSGDETLATAAMMVQMAVYLNKAVVAWPPEHPAEDLLESDDLDRVFRMWGAYGEAANTFRQRGRPAAASRHVDEEVSTPAVVP
jgi:hypothetical protein